VSRRLSYALFLVLAACGGRASSPATAGPAATAEGAVRNFMAAVADSDLAKMANYWGSAKGPAAVTKEPSDYVKRMVIVQAYLRSSGYKVLGESAPVALRAPGDTSAPSAPRAPAPPTDEARQVTVQLYRANCSPLVPFVVIRAATGDWVVNQVDLAAAGTVYKSCGATKDSSRSGG
jgi:hypothetical protein